MVSTDFALRAAALAGAAVAFIMASPWIAAPAAAAALSADGQTTEIDCAGGAAAITGSENEVTLVGGCVAVEVAGDRNAVAVELAPGARIRLSGDDNGITWAAPGGAAPLVEDVGADNILMAVTPE